MRVIYGGRQSGKTTKLIEYMRHFPGTKMLTFSRHRADELDKKYEDLKGSFISLDQFDKKRHRALVIDDLDMILNRLFDCSPAIVSFTPTFCSKPERLAPNEQMAKRLYDHDLENQELF